MCMYVGMCVHVHICVCAGVHVCWCACPWVYIGVYVCTGPCSSLCVYRCVCLSMFICGASMGVSMGMYIHVCVSLCVVCTRAPTSPSGCAWVCPYSSTCVRACVSMCTCGTTAQSCTAGPWPNPGAQALYLAQPPPHLFLAGRGLAAPRTMPGGAGSALLLALSLSFHLSPGRRHPRGGHGVRTPCPWAMRLVLGGQD